jgi:hypothetical protein
MEEFRTNPSYDIILMLVAKLYYQNDVTMVLNVLSQPVDDLTYLKENVDQAKCDYDSFFALTYRQQQKYALEQIQRNQISSWLEQIPQKTESERKNNKKINQYRGLFKAFNINNSITPVGKYQIQLHDYISREIDKLIIDLQDSSTVENPSVMEKPTIDTDRWIEQQKIHLSKIYDKSRSEYEKALRDTEIRSQIIEYLEHFK